jgi:hypothetical protein
VEQRGFEPPVLFVLPYIQVSLVSQEISTQWFAKNRSEKLSPIRFIGGATPKTSGSRTLPRSKKPKKRPAVRIPFAPPTSQCEPPVLFAFFEGGQWTKFHHARSELRSCGPSDSRAGWCRFSPVEPATARCGVKHDERINLQPQIGHIHQISAF